MKFFEDNELFGNNMGMNVVWTSLEIIIRNIMFVHMMCELIETVRLIEYIDSIRFS